MGERWHSPGNKIEWNIINMWLRVSGILAKHVYGILAEDRLAWLYITSQMVGNEKMWSASATHRVLK